MGKGPLGDDGNVHDLGKDIVLNESDDSQFQIKFVDFSQRRKIGFRGAFEFENKHIMIASASQIRILAYFQNIDAVSLENTIQERQQIKNSNRSVSPISRKRQSLYTADSLTAGRVIQQAHSPNKKNEGLFAQSNQAAGDGEEKLLDISEQ